MWYVYDGDYGKIGISSDCHSWIIGIEFHDKVFCYFQKSVIKQIDSNTLSIMWIAIWREH